MRTTHADRPDAVAAVVVAVVAAPSSLSLPSPPPASSSASASFSTFPPPPPPSCYRRRRLTLEKRERKRQRGAPSDHRNGQAQREFVSRSRYVKRKMADAVFCSFGAPLPPSPPRERPSRSVTRRSVPPPPPFPSRDAPFCR